MPLSEHEQRLLEQIERALYAEDPKFASTVRGGRLRKPTRRRRLQGVAVFVVGLVLLVVGVAVPQLWLASSFPVSRVVGFLVMLGGAVARRDLGRVPPVRPAPQAKNAGAGQEPLHRPDGGAFPPPLRAGVAADLSDRRQTGSRSGRRRSVCCPRTRPGAASPIACPEPMDARLPGAQRARQQPPPQRDGLPVAMPARTVRDRRPAAPPAPGADRRTSWPRPPPTTVRRACWVLGSEPVLADQPAGRRRARCRCGWPGTPRSVGLGQHLLPARAGGGRAPGGHRGQPAAPVPAPAHGRGQRPPTARPTSASSAQRQPAEHAGRRLRRRPGRLPAAVRRQRCRHRRSCSEPSRTRARPGVSAPVRPGLRRGPAARTAG